MSEENKKIDQSAELRKRCEEFLKELAQYPHKDITEYTRLEDSLEQFIKHGIWDESQN